MQVSMKRRAKKLSVNKYEEKVDMDWTRATDGWQSPSHELQWRRHQKESARKEDPEKHADETSMMMMMMIHKKDYSTWQY